MTKKTQTKSVLDDRLKYDLIEARRMVNSEFNNRPISREHMLKTIRSWRSTMGKYRAMGIKVYRNYLRSIEMAIILAQELHRDRLRKYEDYHREDVEALRLTPRNRVI